MNITKNNIRKTKLEIIKKYYKGKIEPEKVKEEAINILMKLEKKV